MEISVFLVLIITAVALISHGIGYNRGLVVGWKRCLRARFEEEKTRLEALNSEIVAKKGNSAISMRTGYIQNGQIVHKNGSNNKGE